LSLAATHPDCAEHAELTRSFEDGEHERVHHSEQADDHRQGETADLLGAIQNPGAPASPRPSTDTDDLQVFRGPVAAL
jgi:hypothetical protein